MDKYEVLKKYFGHSSFRSGQEQLVDSILSGRDCLGVMPTGAGKSVCYQVPALLLEGTSIVISPLISLMKDQVEGLLQSGIKAGFINSSLSQEEYFYIVDRAAAGDIDILYVAPERLESESFSKLAERIRIPLIAVDEAHCVSHWGQDFRPSYLKIADFVKLLPERPIIAAFTATATHAVKKDIVDLLELKAPCMLTTGFDRENLYFEVRRVEHREKDAVLLQILRGSSAGSTIVYCSTRKNVEAVAGFLRLNGINALPYHAGLADSERSRAQEDFIYDRCNVIVATNAFGMGIDKSDVSLVVHYNMPKDIESYYQEAGRAGRDGSPARCILLYSRSDVRTAEFLIEHGHEDIDLTDDELLEIRRRDRERLRQMTFYSTTPKCLRSFMLGYFGEKTSGYCGNCSSCNTNFDTVDITVDAQKILSCIFRLSQRGRSGGKALISLILRGSAEQRIIQGGYDTLSTYGIMKDVSQSRIRDIIDHLEQIEYISLEPEHSTCQLTQKANEFVRSRTPLLMKLPKEQERPSAAQSAAPAEDTELMKRLKALRAKLAATLGVPAYVVFTDSSLRDMSVKQPQTQQEFLNISGVGSIKAERYGKKFMEVIRQYKQENRE